jgi:dTDP-4-dehydrorhamnose reductase
MRYLVTGVKGQLGHDVVTELLQRGFSDVFATDVENLDITKKQDVYKFISEIKPNIVIHCAAFTAVDKAEDMQDDAYNINVQGTRYLVEATKSIGSKFIFISTDYVFDGNKNGLYEVDDLPNPISVYGNTKNLGEIETRDNPKHFIIRISWAFGKNGNNFVKTMLRLGKERNEINVVNDQVGSPTYTKDLSKLIVDMSLTDKYGTYHATNEGFCSWYEFSKEIFRLVNYNIKINPLASPLFPTKAKRPLNSRMSKEKLTLNGFDRLPNWKDALKKYLEEIEVI